MHSVQTDYILAIQQPQFGLDFVGLVRDRQELCDSNKIINLQYLVPQPSSLVFTLSVLLTSYDANSNSASNMDNF